MNDDLLRAARRIKLQLDARASAAVIGLPPMLTQALKIQEESGELAEAVLGVLGENPRKGVTHTLDDCIDEAIDVALSALVFGYKVAPDRFDAVVSERLMYLAERAARSGAPTVTDGKAST